MAAWRLFVALAFFVQICFATQKYKDSEKVPIYVNKVGPYYNPHETYHYYTLPVCRPQTIEHKSLTLGEVLDGDRMAKSLYDLNFKGQVAKIPTCPTGQVAKIPNVEHCLNFKEKVEKKELCKVTLSEEQVSAFKLAIEDLYYFEFVIDDIPVRGFIGHLDEIGFPHVHKISLWAHHHFNIEYNGDRIIYANVSTKEAPPVSLDTKPLPHEIAFTYSVNWIPSTVAFSDRVKRLKDNSFFPATLEIHWLSIINSLVLVFLLIGFVVIILTRVLKSDFARYNVDDDETDDLDTEENGWKMIHTDVFRIPPHRNLFCAILGVGSQFLTLATGILLMAMMGMFNVHRHGSINTAALILYAFTSCISGYVACNMYTKMGGENWVWNINLTSSLFALPFFVVWATINTVSLAYGTTQALPWTTIILLGALWLLVGFPLTIIGGIFGKNWANGFDAPCRTKNIAREIPEQPVYRWAVSHCIVGGFLPFSAISVELYYIFATLWGRESYTLYGILFIVYAILISVTACISVALTYFQLSSEDYRWWWRSIFSAGTTGGFVFLYALFYYFKRSHMSGLLQSVEFFGYTILTCYAFFLMLGTVSFFMSLKFIRYIYVSIKMD